MDMSSLPRTSRLLGLLVLSAFIVLGPVPAAAQSNAPAPAQNNASPLTSPQLEQLVAPVALYPDALLSQVLMASTYPLEIVEAARWSKGNQGVTGQALEDAMQQQKWDPSVKSLTSVPQTLEMMNDQLSWTQQLGDAFLAQQEDVLSAVQRLRARADANGYLKSNDNQKVTKAAAPAPSAAGAPAPAPIYTIEPAKPAQYAVPVYNPNVVYGTWPYPAYPPPYYAPPAYAGFGALGFTAAALTGAAIWGGVDWGRNNVNVNVNNFNNFNRTNVANGNWTHNSAHRGSVPYRDSGTAQRFGDPNKAAARDSFRDKADTGRRDMTGQNGRGNQNTRSNAGQGNRANAGAGDRAGNTKQGGQAKRDAGTKQAGTKQAGQAKKNAGTNQGAGNRSAGAGQGARPKAGQTAARGGNAARAGGANRQAAMRGGGGARGGGRRR